MTHEQWKNISRKRQTSWNEWNNKQHLVSHTWSLCSPRGSRINQSRGMRPRITGSWQFDTSLSGSMRWCITTNKWQEGLKQCNMQKKVWKYDQGKLSFYSREKAKDYATVHFEQLFTRRDRQRQRRRERERETKNIPGICQVQLLINGCPSRSVWRITCDSIKSLLSASSSPVSNKCFQIQTGMWLALHLKGYPLY